MYLARSVQSWRAATVVSSCCWSAAICADLWVTKYLCCAAMSMLVRPTEKVDVFAFGVVLYELLSRSLLVSHCAAAVGHNRSRKGGSRHSGSHHNKDKTSGYSPDSAHGSSGDSDSLPEQQLLLAYAQLVAGGYRPPFPSHFPEPVQHLISSCWAAEPHERPRMADVLTQLQELAVDRHVVTTLNSYLAGLADLGYAGPTGPDCRCGCVIS